MQPGEIIYLQENGAIITADSIPDLDEWFIDTWWDCSDWIAWHKANKRKYGLAVANQKFGDYWNQQTSGAGALDCRTFNTTFRDYITKNGLIDTVFESAGLFSYLLKPVGAVSDTISGVTGGISKGAKVMKWAIPTLVIGSVIVLGSVAYKKIKRA